MIVRIVAITMIEVVMSRKLLEGILENARAAYPKEVILLLRGRVKGDLTEITDIIIPPLATRGIGFSAFPLHMLPIDFSLVGVVHSHPSGVAEPSIGDLNNAFGRVAMIVAYPFLGEQDVTVFRRSGERVALRLLE